eukprot:CAMPEP_0197671106 /NCGR_PEP_ID=MMETSP1338-20131121/76006_1 /TAXON_ID=43686 ORGANISM="Pelagodinium beii, Strain RCC1491" /NCGR_SAMPLE_ID=MMETSP1338 /ASSEMBLY_ACC=CAM_ASM_000754 /LENGTH=214 /DNA_ID=CAMNT_0043250943 /DNA_START=180 /DNA_END=821 /DNA_ORIENTATION=+
MTLYPSSPTFDMTSSQEDAWEALFDQESADESDSDPEWQPKPEAMAYVCSPKHVPKKRLLVKTPDSKYWRCANMPEHTPDKVPISPAMPGHRCAVSPSSEGSCSSAQPALSRRPVKQNFEEATQLAKQLVADHKDDFAKAIELSKQFADECRRGARTDQVEVTSCVFCSASRHHVAWANCAATGGTCGACMTSCQKFARLLGGKFPRSPRLLKH